MAGTQDSSFHITDIRARLLYEQSGRLSDDITDNDEFIAWNTVIGEGSALENAHDILITAVIEGDQQYFLNRPLTITVSDEGGKTLAERTIPQMLAEKQTQRSLLLQDAGCAGILKIEARLGRSTRTEEVRLPCGE